jgi:hypothetical protein
MGILTRFHLDGRAVRHSPTQGNPRLTQLCHRNAHYTPHSHRGLTTHLILKGQLTITYPKELDAEKKTYVVGDRIDVDAGRVHEVWMGDEGCTYVIGE